MNFVTFSSNLAKTIDLHNYTIKQEEHNIKNESFSEVLNDEFLLERKKTSKVFYSFPYILIDFF